MKTTSASLAVLSALVSTDLHAARPNDASVSLGAVYVTPEKRNVLGTERILTSVDVMGSERIEQQNVSNSWELLGQMPGIQLTETRMGAESGKATLRAFNGEGYINGIKVLIDGIPSNVNSGNQRFIDMLFPLDIDYIEVVRGTNDPRYGLHNIGGNINFATRQGGNYTDGRVTYGSFDTREVQLALGREEGNFAQNYILAKQDSEGFRDHSRSNKYSLGGKWFLSDDTQDFRLGLVARLYHHQAEEPGFLTASQLAASRTQSPEKNGNDDSDRDMKHLSLHADVRLADTLELSNKLYYNSYDDDRRVTFSDYQPGNAPRQRRLWNERQTGVLSNLTWRANDLLTLDGGINHEQQNNEYQRYRFNHGVPTNFDATPARVQNDERYTLYNSGAYVQAIIQASEKLQIIPAYRVDRFSGNSEMPGGGEGRAAGLRLDSPAQAERRLQPERGHQPVRQLGAHLPDPHGLDQPRLPDRRTTALQPVDQHRQGNRHQVQAIRGQRSAHRRVAAGRHRRSGQHAGNRHQRRPRGNPPAWRRPADQCLPDGSLERLGIPFLSGSQGDQRVLRR